MLPVYEMKNANIEVGFGHSSKGNQLKWEQDGWWYKADAFGYESLAEVVVSQLLLKSSVLNTVVYEPVMIHYQGKRYRGCRSRNFRREKEELIPLERLARSYNGVGLAKQLARIASTKERIAYTEEMVRNITGLEGFGAYLAQLLEIDAFFLNEDRHTNNIALLYHRDQKTYRICPFFDMGLSLFSDEREAYPFEKDFFACREQIKAKPFDRDFDEQLDAANLLYGSYLKFDFSKRKITDVITELRQKYGVTTGSVYTVGMDGYTEAEFRRVEEILRYQAGKYLYMFQD